MGIDDPETSSSGREEPCSSALIAKRRRDAAHGIGFPTWRARQPEPRAGRASRRSAPRRCAPLGHRHIVTAAPGPPPARGDAARTGCVDQDHLAGSASAGALRARRWAWHRDGRRRCRAAGVRTGEHDDDPARRGGTAAQGDAHAIVPVGAHGVVERAVVGRQALARGRPAPRAPRRRGRPRPGPARRRRRS